MSEVPVFDPNDLTAVVSMNRVKIMDLPGVNLEENIQGNYAYYLLGADPIAQLVKLHLGLADLTGNTSEILACWDRTFTGSDVVVKEQAELVARLVGRRIGYLLATLKRGDEINRRERADWQANHWEFWAGIEEIQLGGGLVSGQAGNFFLPAVEEVLAEAGVNDLRVELAKEPSRLALIGAARSLKLDGEVALIFDFGQSWIKRALAIYQNGGLIALELLDPLPSAEFKYLEKGGDLYQKIRDVAVITWQEVAVLGYTPEPTMIASIARYVRDGRPYDRWEPVEYDFKGEVSREISQEVGQPVEIELIHDGTAAARVFAGQNKTAVIMLGTALGIGFPPEIDDFCPIAPDFVIRQRR